MSALPLEPKHGGGRYPGFDVTTQADHWDVTTRAAVMSRLGRPEASRFFTEAEEAAARALVDQLMYQREEPRIPVELLIDTRLTENQTDGWHYETLPPDRDAWKTTLGHLDDDAHAAHGCVLARCTWDEQSAIIQSVQGLGSDRWHGMRADHVWSLWTRYASTAFYAHPWAWNEIGFDGPAYPRGYKNPGIDRLENIEVHDAHPGNDPLATRRTGGDS